MGFVRLGWYEHWHRATCKRESIRGFRAPRGTNYCTRCKTVTVKPKALVSDMMLLLMHLYASAERGWRMMVRYPDAAELPHAWRSDV